MKTTNVVFEEINMPLNNEFIDYLGEKYVSNDDKSMFVIKTSHSDEKMVLDHNETCGFRMESYTDIRTYVLNVFKISNGWAGTIDGHFIYDYKNHIITHISKLEF